MAGELKIATDLAGVDHAMSPEEGVLCTAPVQVAWAVPWARAGTPCPSCTEIVEARTGG